MCEPDRTATCPPLRQLGLWDLLSGRSTENHDRTLIAAIARFSQHPASSATVVGLLAFIGCIVVGLTIHEPVPRVTDEFSYLLNSNTLASGHVASAAPPLPEFFDTFHVLIAPVYAAKVFPAQGLFLAVGERLTGHPAFGLWLTAGLASAATCWMLQGWVGPQWGLLGGIVMLIQYGVFSYWSHTYWGGMVPALGGALVFGSARRLWDQLSGKLAIWLSIGCVILANSRPVEGAIVAAPILLLLLYRIRSLTSRSGLIRRVLIPVTLTLGAGLITTGMYNRAITGSFWMTPYALHEAQYQVSPPFIFMNTRPIPTYSSGWIRRYYLDFEGGKFQLERRVPEWIRNTNIKLHKWWLFYLGTFLTVPIVLANMRRTGLVADAQVLLLVSFVALSGSEGSVLAAGLSVIAMCCQWILIFVSLDRFWDRVALVIAGLVLIENLFLKWNFAHYFAPASSLVLVVEVASMRALWLGDGLGRPHSLDCVLAKLRISALVLCRCLVLTVVVAAATALMFRVAVRVAGYPTDLAVPSDLQFLPLSSDWSLRRSALQKWLESQSRDQLVFVRYSERHSVTEEWVYNHAGIVSAHVVWARDLGDDHNRYLISALSGRTVWLLEPDTSPVALTPYNAGLATATHSLPDTGARRSLIW
jgi:hypothetical protein